MKFLKFTIVSLVLMAVSSSCGFQPYRPGLFEPPKMGSLMGFTEAGDLDCCDPIGYVPSDQSGVFWEYDGNGTLYLHHLNAAFRCESEVHGRVEIDGWNIAVKEIDEGYGDEFCLYNLDYMITGLKPGKYYIWLEEPILMEGDDALYFVVHLRSEPAWNYETAYRIDYPWSPDDIPWGQKCQLCGPFPEVVQPDFGPKQVCIAFWYTEGVLKLRHTGERIGCGQLMNVDITVDGPIITVEEYAIGSSYCLAISHADIEMEIYNLPPATYRLEVYSFKRSSPPIELELDLENSPDGFFCYFP
jgi:hypothetical protein